MHDLDNLRVDIDVEIVGVRGKCSGKNSWDDFGGFIKAGRQDQWT